MVNTRDNEWYRYRNNEEVGKKDKSECEMISEIVGELPN